MKFSCRLIRIKDLNLMIRLENKRAGVIQNLEIKNIRFCFESEATIGFIFPIRYVFLSRSTSINDIK